MKIIFINTRYWPAIGGVENSIRTIGGVLSNEHSVKIVCALNRNLVPSPARLSVLAPCLDKYYDNKIEVIPINPSIKNRILSAFAMVYYIPKIRRYFYNQLLRLSIKNYKWAFKYKLKQVFSGVDIVHSHTSAHLGWAAYEAAKELNIAYVITPHMHPGQYGDGPADIELYKNADAVIALSEPEKKFYLTAGIKKENIFVAGEAASVAVLDSTKLLQQKYDLFGYNIVIFIGRKQKYKGVLELRKAADEVWKQFPKTKFLFIGPAYKGCIIDTKDSRIINVESATENEKSSFIALSDMLCLPSQYESFGIVVLEAWALKKPVIVSDNEVLRSLIKDGADGIVAKPQSIYIAEAIMKLIKNPQTASQYGLNGFDKYINKYTPELVSKEYADIYKKILERIK
ncbi:MAG: glycosyltransferase family 4 protein [Candidatus Omnitrophica bacterium]|nr:glycosyltransferase family 4 protein [Candidatus Omnitrophota bacterium]